MAINPYPRVGTAMVPCTCGELVQGVLDDVPFLVSCPIDRFSRVKVVLRPQGGQTVASPLPPESGRFQRPPADKAIAAVRGTLQTMGCGDAGFSLEVSCPLPPSRGFGTSTSDVVGAIVATSAALGAVLPPEEVARLAVGVEPSDSTMFPGLALFDHRGGSRWEPLALAPPLLVAVLDLPGTVDTVEFNTRLDLGVLRSREREHARALDWLRQGLAKRRPDLIGRAATLSAEANQRLLFKADLERVIDLGRRHGALGVCAAHSGTTLGVLFDANGYRDAFGLVAEARGVLEGLQDGWVSRIVDGGARLLEGSMAGYPGRLPAKR